MQKLFLKQYAAFLNLIFYYAKTTQEIKILCRINHEFSPNIPAWPWWSIIQT
jgi:hypothetical protein